MANIMNTQNLIKLLKELDPDGNLPIYINIGTTLPCIGVYIDKESEHSMLVIVGDE